MSQQKPWRDGWQSENIAKAILYKIAFVTEPSQVADDIGIDFICTLFTVKKHNRKIDLLPKNSFAVQIKSKLKKRKQGVIYDLSKSIDSLCELQMPFYIGVIDRGATKLALYSGELLDFFLSKNGKPVTLRALLVEEKSQMKVEEMTNDTIPFIKVADLLLTENVADDIIHMIAEKCKMVQENIASRLLKKYILKQPSTDITYFFAGSDSINTFQLNVVDSLASAFYHLHWCRSDSRELTGECEIFKACETFYNHLKSIYSEDIYFSSHPIHTIYTQCASHTW